MRGVFNVAWVCLGFLCDPLRFSFPVGDEAAADEPCFRALARQKVRPGGCQDSGQAVGRLPADGNCGRWGSGRASASAEGRDYRCIPMPGEDVWAFEKYHGRRRPSRICIRLSHFSPNTAWAMYSLTSNGIGGALANVPKAWAMYSPDSRIVVGHFGGTHKSRVTARPPPFETDNPPET